MSFEKKIAAHFDGFSLVIGSKPARHLIHLYADYVELVALFSKENFISASDIQDRFKDEGIIQQAEKTQDQAEQNDLDEGLVDKVFRLINERILLFDQDYPFLIHDHDKLKLKSQGDINDKAKVYLFLLLSSSLNLFKVFKSELTSEFEDLCYYVLKNILPDNAIVRSFGSKSEFTGTAVEKIKALANEMNVDVIDRNLDEISTKGTQDRGLDLIGWIPFDDSVPNFLSILGQCACGKEWYKKMTESRRYEKYMEFEGQPPIHSMFIPYNLVSHAKKTFFQNDEFNVPTIVFERKRILNYLDDVSFFDDYQSKLLVEKCMEFEEDIV